MKFKLRHHCYPAVILSILAVKNPVLEELWGPIVTAAVQEGQPSPSRLPPGSGCGKPNFGQVLIDCRALCADPRAIPCPAAAPGADGHSRKSSGMEAGTELSPREGL